MNCRPALLLPAERGLFRSRRTAGRPGRKLRRAQCSGRGTDGAWSVNDAGEQAGAADERTGGAINGWGRDQGRTGNDRRTVREPRGAGGNGVRQEAGGNPRALCPKRGSDRESTAAEARGRAIPRRCLRRGEADQQKNGAQFAVCGRLRPVCVMKGRGENGAAVAARQRVR